MLAAGWCSGTIVELNNVLVVESGHTNGAPLGMLFARALEFVAREYTHSEGKKITSNTRVKIDRCKECEMQESGVKREVQSERCLSRQGGQHTKVTMCEQRHHPMCALLTLPL